MLEEKNRVYKCFCWGMFFYMLSSLFFAWMKFSLGVSVCVTIILLYGLLVVCNSIVNTFIFVDTKKEHLVKLGIRFIILLCILFLSFKSKVYAHTTRIQLKFEIQEGREVSGQVISITYCVNSGLVKNACFCC